MLGIDDGFVALAYVLCLASTVLCVIYAWINWNRGDDAVQEEDRAWQAKEETAKEDV